MSKAITYTDILIIGGGPAGLAAGIVCARHGLHTVICEWQAHYPIDKACGEGIMPTGVDDLRQLGVAECLKPSDVFPFRGISYYSPGGRSAHAEFLEGPGWGIRRQALSQAMQAAASDYNCLRIVNEVRIDRLEKGEGCVIGWSGEAGYSSRMLIGADGMNSNVRTFLNPNPPTRTHFRWGLRRHFQIAPWCDEVEVYWGNEIEAYVTPVGRETINLAFLCNRSILDRHLPKTDRMRSCLERFPILQKRLADAQPVDEIRAIGPLEQPVRQTVGDGVVLLGDSAGYLDAITGEGISLALGSALLFEHIVIPRLTANPRGMLSAMELRPFSTLQTRQFQNYARFARLALYFSDKSRWLEAAIGFLGSRPRLFQYLLSCNLGTAELHPSAFPLVFGSEPHRRKL